MQAQGVCDWFQTQWRRMAQCEGEEGGFLLVQGRRTARGVFLGALGLGLNDCAAVSPIPCDRTLQCFQWWVMLAGRVTAVVAGYHRWWEHAAGCEAVPTGYARGIMCDSVCVEKFVVQLISRHACGMCAASL